MNVSIIGQIILESYINKESMRRSENFTTFLNSKLKKLYCLFDSLLNILSKNYIGLLQDVNSQELAINYQFIKIFLSITSSSGATLSLNESEQRMKEKANSDFCYYNTYFILIWKKSLKIPKGQSETVYRRRTDNTMAKRKKHKRTNNDRQNIHIKLKIE